MFESFVHLHPIFEIFISIYIGLLLAPKFLREHLDGKLDGVDESLTRVKNEMEDKLLNINLDIQKFKLSKLAKEPTFGRIPKLTVQELEKFITEKANPLVSSMFNSLTVEEEKKRLLYDPNNGLVTGFMHIVNFYDQQISIVFFIFNLIILILNGCSFHNNESEFITSLSYFNLISFVLLISLLYYSLNIKKIREIKLISAFTWNKFLGVLLITFIAIFCFRSALPSYFNDPADGRGTIFSTVFIGGFPILIYIFLLGQFKSNFFNFTFYRNYKPIFSELDQRRNEFNNSVEKWNNSMIEFSKSFD